LTFDDFTHWLGRRFCSVLLARMLTPRDWQGAVRYLDFPERFINDGYNTTFAKLRTNGRFDKLAVRVKAIANQHAEGGVIDHKQRRARLADWDGIDSRHLLEPRPRLLSPWRRVDKPLRRAQSSLWLWCHLTSGHERAAPIPIPTRRGLSDQTHFLRHLLPAYRDRLLILGELLLDTPADARSTLRNRVAAARHERRHITDNFYLDAIDPLIISRVLAHTSAHTGVDIATITKPSQCSHAPPAVTHARLLAAELLRRTSLAAWAAIAAAIGGDTNHIGNNNWSYQAAIERHPEPRLRRAIRSARSRHRELVPAAADSIQPHRTTNACATSRSRSRLAPPSSSSPRTASTWHEAPASPSAAPTPTSPATTSPPSTTSKTPSRRSQEPPSPVAVATTPSSTTDTTSYSTTRVSSKSEPASPARTSNAA
jgi:hypothetical protein